MYLSEIARISIKEILYKVEKLYVKGQITNTFLLFVVIWSLFLLLSYVVTE